MTEILRFLIEHLPFLCAPDGYRFVDSGSSTSFGGDAFLVLESHAMRVRIVRDRGQLFMDFQALSQRGELDWFSLDVVRRLLTGEQQVSAELTSDQVKFLRERFAEIEHRFRGSAFAEIEPELKRLEHARAKELFG